MAAAIITALVAAVRHWYTAGTTHSLTDEIDRAVDVLDGGLKLESPGRVPSTARRTPSGRKRPQSIGKTCREHETLAVVVREGASRPCARQMAGPVESKNGHPRVLDAAGRPCRQETPVGRAATPGLPAPGLPTDQTTTSEPAWWAPGGQRQLTSRYPTPASVSTLGRDASWWSLRRSWLTSTRRVPE